MPRAIEGRAVLSDEPADLVATTIAAIPRPATVAVIAAVILALTR
jgi:hypothetical protein